jgi:hypothetical protein
MIGSRQMTRKAFITLALGIPATSVLFAQLPFRAAIGRVSKPFQFDVTGEITLRDGKNVEFNHLTRDKDEPGGLLDQAYSQVTAGTPNLPYRENLGQPREPVTKLIFEDVTKID